MSAVSEPGKPRQDSRRSDKVFCEGGSLTCETCVGSCCIEEWEITNRIEVLERAIRLMMAIPASERREMKRVGREALNG